jgi:hypothetical protein
MHVMIITAKAMLPDRYWILICRSSTYRLANPSEAKVGRSKYEPIIRTSQN